MLLTQNGLALFKVQFEALVDRKLVDEIVMGKLLEITR